MGNLYKTKHTPLLLTAFLLSACAEHVEFSTELASNELNPGIIEEPVAQIPSIDFPEVVPTAAPTPVPTPALPTSFTQTWENQVKINELRMVLVMDSSGSMSDDTAYVQKGLTDAMAALAPTFKNICVGVMAGQYTGANRGRLITDPTVNDACLCTGENYTAEQIVSGLQKNMNYITAAADNSANNTEAVGFAAYKSLTDAAAVAFNMTAGGGGCGKSAQNDVAYLYQVFTDEAYLNAKSNLNYVFEAGSEGNTKYASSYETQMKALHLSELQGDRYKLIYNETMLADAYRLFKGINPGALYSYTMHMPFTATSQEEENPELAMAAKLVSGPGGERDLSLARTDAAAFTKGVKDSITEYATKKSGYRDTFDLTIPDTCVIENLKVYVDDVEKTDKIEIVSAKRFRIKAPDHEGVKVKATFSQKAGSKCS